ncbi:MAG: translation elongation factor-like protein [Candidatus Micrarchaeaceae archaeon]
MDNLDNAMENLKAWEEKEKNGDAPGGGKDRILVGSVDKFFDRISVAAINLSGDLKIGDIIEIGGTDDAIRQKISSMQIDRIDVEEAHEGDSIGIKVAHQVHEGEEVYKVTSYHP